MDAEEVKVTQYVVKLVAEKLKCVIDEKQNTFKFHPWQDICTFSKIKEKIHPGLHERAVHHLSVSGTAEKIIHFLNEESTSKKEQEVKDCINKYLGLKSKQRDSSKKIHLEKYKKRNEEWHGENEHLKMVEVRRLVDAITRQILNAGQLSHKTDLCKSQQHLQKPLKEPESVTYLQKLPICPYSTCIFVHHQLPMPIKKTRTAKKIKDTPKRNKVCHNMDRYRLLRKATPSFFNVSRSNHQLNHRTPSLQKTEITTAVEKTSVTCEKTETSFSRMGFPPSEPTIPESEVPQSPNMELNVSDSEFYGKSDTLNDASMISEDLVSVIENHSPALKSEVSVSYDEANAESSTIDGDSQLPDRWKNGKSPDVIHCSESPVGSSVKRRVSKSQRTGSGIDKENQPDVVKTRLGIWKGKIADQSNTENSAKLCVNRSEHNGVVETENDKANVIQGEQVEKDAIGETEQGENDVNGNDEKAEKSETAGDHTRKPSVTKNKKAVKIANRGLIHMMKLSKKKKEVKAQVNVPEAENVVAIAEVAPTVTQAVLPNLAKAVKGVELANKGFIQLLKRSSKKKLTAESQVKSTEEEKAITNDDAKVDDELKADEITNCDAKKTPEETDDTGIDSPKRSVDESSDDETTYSPLMSTASDSEASDQSSEWSSIKENDNRSQDYTSHWMTEEWSEDDESDEDSSFREMFFTYKRSLLEEDAGVLASCEDEILTSNSERLTVREKYPCSITTSGEDGVLTSNSEGLSLKVPSNTSITVQHLKETLHNSIVASCEDEVMTSKSEKQSTKLPSNSSENTPSLKETLRTGLNETLTSCEDDVMTSNSERLSTKMSTTNDSLDVPSLKEKDLDTTEITSTEDKVLTSNSENLSIQVPTPIKSMPIQTLKEKFLCAVDEWNLEKFQEFLNEDKTLLELKDDNGWNLLHKSAANGQCDFVQVLLENGMQVDSVTPNEMTALYLAILNNHLECCKLLLRQGANLVTNEGSNPDVIEKAATTLTSPIKILLEKYHENFIRVNQLSDVFNRVDEKRKRFSRTLSPNLLQTIADMTLDEDDD